MAHAIADADPVPHAVPNAIPDALPDAVRDAMTGATPVSGAVARSVAVPGAVPVSLAVPISRPVSIAGPVADAGTVAGAGPHARSSGTLSDARTYPDPDAARTDADPLPGSTDGLKDRPEARNLVNIYAALADETPDQVLARFEGQGFGAFKPALAELAVASLEPITRRMNDYMADPAEIDRILGEGAVRADAIATPILERTKEIMGLLRTRP